MAGSRDHFSLRLRKWRLTTGQTVLSSCAAAAVSAAIGLIAMNVPADLSLYCYGSILVLLLIVAFWLKAVDMSL